MRELKFICIEDDSVFLKKTMNYIEEYYLKQGYIVSFDTYDSVPQNLKLENRVACFFDIEVIGGNTLQMIKDIRDKDITIPIIIISQYDDYAFETVHMQIFDYIRKLRFDEEIGNTLVKLDKVILNTIDHVLINCDGRNMKMYFKDILYVHIKSHRFTIHYIDGHDMEVWKDYDDVFIKNSTLLRAHKSYAININYCESISKYKAVLKECHDSIPISTRNYNEILNSFILKHSLIK